ncbi:hypothetical protein NEPAR04_1033 [Nematocida parisii]|nr:hypothetical protein NEPAR04_1033 [Nematocida parisii]
MLLSREHLISSIRSIQPTYDSLSCIIEYIMLFRGELEAILDVIMKESKNSNAHTNLFIMYMLNELSVKLSCAEDSNKDQEIKSVKKALKEVLKTGRKRVDSMTAHGTPGLKKAAGVLTTKYNEMEKLLYMKPEEIKAQSAKKEAVLEKKEKRTEEVNNSKEDIDEKYLDIEYLESLCKKKDKKSVIKYIKELKKNHVE